METQEILICRFCNVRLDKNSRRERHVFICQQLENHKSSIIEEYNSGTSLNGLWEKYKIDAKRISSFLKTNNVRIKSDGHGLYKIHENVDENYFKMIDRPEKAWMLGLYAADGCIKNNAFSISQSGPSGLELISYIKQKLKIRNKIAVCKTTGRDSYSIQASSKNVVSDLSNYNIVPRKSLIYEFPENLPQEFLKDFIRGYIEGDGCIGVYKNRKGCIYLSVSFVGTPMFVKKCSELIPIKHGGIVVCSGSKNVREIRWYGEKAVLFCDWLFSSQNLYLSYKYFKYKEFVEFTNISPTKYMFYKKKKEEAQKFFLLGKSCMQTSKLINIPFQTIYRWKNENVFGN
jgi:hypothetical protein